MSMLRFTRRGTVMAAAALALAACGSSTDSSESNSSSSGSDTDKVVLQDIVFGDPNAPVTLVEYASWTCPACLVFHQRVLPSIKTDYIDTGQVKLVFREFPTAPANVTVAGFALARCTEGEAYYDMLDELFVRQDAILTLARQGGPVVEALKQVASNHGIEGDDAFEACLESEDNRDAIRASIAAARGVGVDSTPTFFLNGERMDGNARISVQAFAAELDAALAASAGE
ncbi:MAG: DsbA family protein [Hyphomonadaceae bacterium]|nr:DsbA family protein [Hyphomonadaceae bacterium]